MYKINIYIYGFAKHYIDVRILGEGEGAICNDISNNNVIRLCIYQNENCFIEYQKVYGGRIYIEEKEKVQQVIKYVLIMNGDYVEQTQKIL